MPRRPLVACVAAVCTALAALAWSLDTAATPPSQAPDERALATADEPAVATATAGAPASATQRTTPPNAQTAATHAASPGDVELVVHVAQGTWPLAGAVVQLFPLRARFGEERAWMEIARGERSAQQIARTDKDGDVRFPGPLEHGAIAWVDGTTVWRSVDAVTQRSARCEIVLGPASVHGIAYDAHGSPRCGVVIHASGDTYVGKQTWIEREHSVAVTDADGTFALGGLPSEIVDVSCAEADGLPREARKVLATALRPGFVQFGVAPGSCWWRGRVVDANGAVVPGFTTLRFDDLEHGERRAVLSAVDGTFATQLPASMWRGQVDHGGAARTTTASATAGLGGRDHVEDLQFPGHHVLCRLATAHAAIQPWFAEMELVLDRDGVRAVNRPPFEWNGARWMAWRGLDAGVYRLRGGHRLRCLGEPDGGFSLDLCTAPRLEFEVVLTDH
ncbi:MAG TPA: hypothetical protein VFZ65_11715 [Planctomycetota bacterium]|nr:hypothetical protein [Planctomycetota bacterium]